MNKTRFLTPILKTTLIQFVKNTFLKKFNCRQKIFNSRQGTHDLKNQTSNRLDHRYNHELQRIV